MINGRIIIDSSSWIEVFNKITNERTSLIHSYLLSGIKISICPPIFQEVLQGARSEKEWQVIYDMLIYQDLLQMEPYQCEAKAARMYFQLRKSGITIRKPNDCIIAVYALENNLPLIHNDKDFDQIAQLFPLRNNEY